MGSECWDNYKFMVDFTYNGVSFPDGTLPAIGWSNLKLKDPRGVVAVTQGTYVRYFPGYSFSGTPSTNHEWYNNNYEHNHSANPPTLDDTQLMWCKWWISKWFCGIFRNAIYQRH